MLKTCEWAKEFLASGDRASHLKRGLGKRQTFDGLRSDLFRNQSTYPTYEASYRFPRCIPMKNWSHSTMH